MSEKFRGLGLRLGILLGTCFGVFVLPFLLPPPYFQGVSASNLAGFNNKVAAVAAASIASLVFFLSLKWPRQMEAPRDTSTIDYRLPPDGELSRLAVVSVVLLWGWAVFLFGAEIIRMGIRYESDWGYFINRMSMHADFGRQLYTQIEFPYGPLLYYGPLAMKTLCSPFHLSLTDAYLATLVLQVMIGVLLLAYVIEFLPISKRWKLIIFVILSAGMMVGNMGLNYTLLRFDAPLAFLMMASRRKRAWAAVLWTFVGEAVCLGLSAEIGFAFLAGCLGLTAGSWLLRKRSLLLAGIAPIVSATLFLLVAGLPYLRMVSLYARGAFGFPVEPLPHILLFLFALVWLVPVTLARFFREGRPEAAVLGALYVVSVVLLPSALGRADPGHVFWNGLSILLLSVVAISSRRIWEQITWGVFLGAAVLWMCNINRLVNWGEMSSVVHAEHRVLRDISNGRHPGPEREVEAQFNLKALQAIVGQDRVATPVEVTLPVENALRASGQYSPSFYYGDVAVFDVVAEDRYIKELNQSIWALIPEGPFSPHVERPEELAWALGFQLPYRTRRPVYALGVRFQKNLADNWQVQGKVGRYLIYRRR